MRGSEGETMSQNSRLLNYLEIHDGVTTYEATLILGICRLSERIRELERLRYSFTRTKEKKQVVRYRLNGHEPQR